MRPEQQDYHQIEPDFENRSGRRSNGQRRPRGRSSRLDSPTPARAWPPLYSACPPHDGRTGPESQIEPLFGPVRVAGATDNGALSRQGSPIPRPRPSHSDAMPAELAAMLGDQQPGAAGAPDTVVHVEITIRTAGKVEITQTAA